VELVTLVALCFYFKSLTSIIFRTRQEHGRNVERHLLASCAEDLVDR
jgi:hypothetical protein